MKKYELTEEFIEFYGKKLFRIKALIKINGTMVSAGDVGGFIESEENLDQYGAAWVYGAARVSGAAYIKFGVLNISINTFKEIQYIAASINEYPINGEYTIYKRVNKIRGLYKSCFDKNFIYTIGEFKMIEDANADIDKSCASGIHASHATYWTEGNCLIALKIRHEDIITCLEGKLRCKKVFVIGEVWCEE